MDSTILSGEVKIRSRREGVCPCRWRVGSRTCCDREGREQRSRRHFAMKEDWHVLEFQLICGQLKSPSIKVCENFLESTILFNASANFLSSSKGVWGGLYIRAIISFSFLESFTTSHSESMKAHLERGLGEIVEVVREDET